MIVKTMVASRFC